MANLSLAALGRRVDRLTIPTVDRPVIVVRFVGHGGEPAQPINQVTCRDVVYSRDDKESEKDFLARIELQNPPIRQSGTVILVHG